MLKILRVDGLSMAPNALEGDYILIYKFFHKSKSKPGDWVVFDHPRFGLLLKECVKINTKKHTFRSRSINPHGLTEKEMGDISFSAIIGKVFWLIPNLAIQ